MNQDPKREDLKKDSGGSGGRRYGLFGVSAYPSKKGMDEQRRQSMVRWSNAVIVFAAVVVVVLIIIGANSGGLTVTFDSQGGSSVASQSVPYGNKVETPGEVLRPGYSLVCWSRTPDGSEPWDFEKDTVQEGIVLYAVWSPES